MPGPLDGVRIFDVTMYMAGPWSTWLLGALGAEVLHVERPDAEWSTLNAGTPPLINGTASGYIGWNMNKRGVAIDFKDPADRQFAYDLIATCDVFVSNMRPLDRMGLLYETLKEINPQLVYCHTTGFGRGGPRGGDRGMDAVMQIYGGMWSAQGARGGLGEQYRHATQVDATTGNLLAQAVLLGLHARERTGEGQFIEVTMVDAVAMNQLPRVVETLAGVTHQPQGSSAFATAPDRAFMCEDRRWIGISITTEGQWRQLCDALGVPELVADPRFADNAARVANRDELDELIAPRFVTKPRSYWELFLTRANVPWGAPLMWEHLRYHEQVQANDMIVEVPTDAWGTVWAGGPPWRFSRTPAKMIGPPIPGIDTDELKDAVDAGTLTRRADTPVPGADGAATTALAGLRVLELAEGVAGPLAARLLGDAGADVIKVEVGDGDRARRWAPEVDGVGAVFPTLNRNKRAIAVDDASSPSIESLVALADVFIVDHDLARAMAVDVDTLMQRHPDVVVCVVSGWGGVGPWADRVGGELPAQLASETTQSLGRPGEEPVRMSTEHAGVSCACYAAQGILAALLARDGGGQRIDVSLFGALLHMRTSMWVALSNPDEWWGFHLDNYTKPPEHYYTCKDRRVAIQVHEVPDRVALLKDLDMEFAFEDPRWEIFRTDTGPLGRHGPLVHDIWDRGLAQWTFEEAREIVARHGGLVLPCFTYEEFVSDPQVAYLGVVVDVDGDGIPARDIRPPWQLDATPATVRAPAPRVNQHASEVDAIVAAGEWKALD